MANVCGGRSSLRGPPFIILFMHVPKGLAVIRREGIAGELTLCAVLRLEAGAVGSWTCAIPFAKPILSIFGFHKKKLAARSWLHTTLARVSACCVGTTGVLALLAIFLPFGFVNNWWPLGLNVGEGLGSPACSRQPARDATGAAASEHLVLQSVARPTRAKQ